jgi:hypothetical protein
MTQGARACARKGQTKLLDVLNQVAGKIEYDLEIKIFNDLGQLMHHSEPTFRHLVILDPAS